MDNVTHSLAGMLVAELACTLRREPAGPELRAKAYLLSALANNLPDIDIVYSWITRPKPLGSLLHHRGHTHTLLVALPAAWLLGWLFVRHWRRRDPRLLPAPSKFLLSLALAGPLLHLLMDFGNNYGVHPFWPLDNRWFYGDTIFIVEPLWLVVAIPVLLHTLSRRWLKVLLGACLGGVLILTWFVPFVPAAVRYLLVALTALSYVSARSFSPRARVLYACAGCAAVPLLFGVGRAVARSELRAATVAAFPALEIHDIATTPMPGNPSCWEGLVVGEQGGQYRVIRARVGLPPLPPQSCSAGSDVDPTATVQLLKRADHGGVRWINEYHERVDALRDLRRRDCRFAALLRFARAPYVHRSAGRTSFPAQLWAGDLRYDRERDRDFSDLELWPESPAECPRFVPGWDEPRGELFRSEK